MKIGYLGLGKMGQNMVARLLSKGHGVVVWNRSPAPRRVAARRGATPADTPLELLAKLPSPRLIWLMLPAGIVDDILGELSKGLRRGDTVIDGGNSFYKDSIRRASALARHGIRFLDVGVSGGPRGARNGACIMVGGDRGVFRKYERLFKDLSLNTECSYIPRNVGTSGVRDVGGGYAYVGTSGAGHFAKMVHNGIEYGMMQSLGEGFEILKSSPFSFDLRALAALYNKRSVIESRLVCWLEGAYRKHGANLRGISGEVAQSGEGLWTVKTAKELGIPAEIIERSLVFRLRSKGRPSYTGQVVSALRGEFGGHDVNYRRKKLKRGKRKS